MVGDICGRRPPAVVVTLTMCCGFINTLVYVAYELWYWLWRRFGPQNLHINSVHNPLASNYPLSYTNTLYQHLEFILYANGTTYA